ncbi:hypothetical protein DSO57_1003433 [Entomophthora muscae]|uniref:Uncharacterized protein n=1 Tax=Entomophthora muscae TaxID=34485 RepID=A0ACC2UHD6_9FUNG|nr:hypothetical protein DSO57_1003433 [Entomophthora muscae]
MVLSNTKSSPPPAQEGFGLFETLANGDLSVEQVDEAMKQMDKRFHTQFYAWILQWPVLPGVVDLVVTLVIGERSSKTARFLHHLTSTWDTASITELVGAIAVRLRWTERYFKHFLLQFACLGERGWEEKRGLVYSIRHRFNSRRLLMQHAAMLTHDSSIHPSLSLVEFALAILCTIIDQPNPLKSPSTEISISPSAFRLPKTAPASPFLSSSTPSEDLQENPPRSPCSAKLPLTTR